MSEGRTDIKKGIFRRVRVLYALFFFVGMLIAGKILYLQYGPKGPALRNKGTTITYERVKLEADRGDVLACDGRILATSVPMYEVRMDFAANGLIDSVFLRDVDSLAGSLSSFFGDKSKGAYKLMLVNAFRNRKKNRYTLISPRRVNHLEIKQIAKFPLFRLGQNRSGFIARQINKRMLPHGRMAARTIGMVNEAGTRLGIEGAFDSVLRGIDGSVMMQRVSGSFRVPVPDEMNVDPVDGIDVVTTLDVDIQDVAEKALRDQLIAMQADWGTAILMEVATGEIRAMANLTRYSDERVVEDFNYAIGMNLEPGLDRETGFAHYAARRCRGQSRRNVRYRRRTDRDRPSQSGRFACVRIADAQGRFREVVERRVRNGRQQVLPGRSETLRRSSLQDGTRSAARTSDRRGAEARYPEAR